MVGVSVNRRILRVRFITTFLIVSTLAIEVPASETERVESYLKGVLKTQKHPGFSVLVSRDQQVLYQQAYGVADMESGRLNYPDTTFLIGSITKQFTSAAILKLQEQGKLSVQDPLGKYFPGWPRGDEVTLHHLLTHTSGIHNFTSSPTFPNDALEAVDPKVLIAAIREMPYDFSPGAKWSYSNSGYFLLGAIVEKVSGKAYGVYLFDQFFGPLGMQRTGVYRHDSETTESEAMGHAGGLQGYYRSARWHMSWTGGAGALYSTTGDLNRWNESVFGGKVLRPESLDLALAPVQLPEGEPQVPYGYGWMVHSERGQPQVAHGGGLLGFVSYCHYFPKQKLSVVVLCNASIGYIPEQMSMKLAEIYLGAQLQPPPSRVVDESLLGRHYDDYVGEYDYGSAVMVITRDGDQLWAQLGTQQRHEVFPAAMDEFFWKIVNARVRFQRDKEGKVIAAEHKQSGVTINAPRQK